MQYTDKWFDKLIKDGGFPAPVSPTRLNMFDIAVLWLVVPLKTFQKFCGLNADRFGKIAGSVELRPVPLCYEFTDRVDA